MTDYDDFKRFSGTSAADPLPKPMQGNILSVGLRSDGSVFIMSAPGKPGPNTANSFIMDRPTARWIAAKILRLTAELPSDTKGSP